MSDDVFAGLPSTEPDRWLRSLGPFADEQGKHFRLAIDCTLARASWRARRKRLLAALGMHRAADRISLQARIDIELFAIQLIQGSSIATVFLARISSFRGVRVSSTSNWK
ncbi:hypothetical protein [Roseateles noduli]|uniref:hypothetical protein n=1 Tax=Roseateles noduli TaxID=2052484 RepID=UPI003D65B38A